MSHRFLLALAGAIACSCGAAFGAEPIVRSVPSGNYRILFPDDGDVRGAYVYFHGFKGSAELQMQQAELMATTLDHHLAYVAVDGTKGGWSFPNGAWTGRDEKVFITEVLDDLAARDRFTAGKIVLGGFSIGASMAWYTACQQGQRAAAMVTFSGVFWNPLPRPVDCVAEIPPMVHFHGTADRTFPLSGRAIGTARHQGDTFRSIAILRARALCEDRGKTRITLDGIDCDEAPGCIRGSSVLCIHDGGHQVRADMLDAGLTAVGFPK